MKKARETSNEAPIPNGSLNSMEEQKTLLQILPAVPPNLPDQSAKDAEIEKDRKPIPSVTQFATERQ